MGKRGLFGPLEYRGNFKLRGATVSAKEAGRRILTGAVRASQSGKAHKSVIYPALIVLLAVIALVVTLTTAAFAATSGPNNPTTAVDNSGTGSVPWTTPENVISPGAAYATAAVTSSSASTISGYRLWLHPSVKCTHRWTTSVDKQTGEQQ